METEKDTKKKKALRAELREKTAGYVLTALGLVAGLAWNDAISSTIKRFFPLDGDGLMVKFIYAVIVTIGIVLVSHFLLRVMTGKED
jgi:hypothetical protein